MLHTLVSPVQSLRFDCMDVGNVGEEAREEERRAQEARERRRREKKK